MFACSAYLSNVAACSAFVLNVAINMWTNKTNEKKKTSEHILFICPALEFNRSQLIMYTTNAMPNTMTEEFVQYNTATKLSFLLPRLRSKFTPE